MQGQTKKVYFTKGHGEKDTASAERDGYKAIADGLGRDNYSVESVVLAQTGAVADDAAVVIVAGPKVDFLPGEIDALKKYLGKSGKLLLEIDPPEKPDSPPLTNLIALAHDWGIDLGNDIVVDASGMGQLVGTDASKCRWPPAIRRIPSRSGSSSSRAIRSRVPSTAVPGGVNGHTAQGFVETSPRSWAESDIKGLLTSGKVSMNAASGDKPGPDHGCRGRLGGGCAGDRAEAGRRRRAEAGNAGRRVRRFGFRDERGARPAGQPRPVHEHDRLAVAAGKPDLDPAEGTRRPARHDDGGADRPTSRCCRCS